MSVSATASCCPAVTASSSTSSSGSATWDPPADRCYPLVAVAALRARTRRSRCVRRSRRRLGGGHGRALRGSQRRHDPPRDHSACTTRRPSRRRAGCCARSDPTPCRTAVGPNCCSSPSSGSPISRTSSTSSGSTSCCGISVHRRAPDRGRHDAPGDRAFATRGRPAGRRWRASSATSATSASATSGTIGGNLAFADPHSDPATYLAAVGGSVTVRGTGPARTVPIEEFVLAPYMTTLAPGNCWSRSTSRRRSPTRSSSTARCPFRNARRSPSPCT